VSVDLSFYDIKLNVVVNNTEINSSYLNHCFLFCVNFFFTFIIGLEYSFVCLMVNTLRINVIF
jgi:hypothetical protein